MTVNVHEKISGTWRPSRYIYAKIGGTWRWVDRVYAKVSGTWRRSFKRFYFPASAIIPYWQNIGSIASGWAQYTSCPSTYAPIGVNSWGLGATASSGSVTATSVSTSNHTGTIYAGYNAYGSPACHYANVLCTTANGGHNHTVSFDPYYTIPYIGSPFIYATANTYTFPNNGWVFSYGLNLGVYGLSQIGFSATQYWLFQGRGSNTNSASSTSTGTAATTSAYAGHTHGGTGYFTGCVAGANMYLHQAGGSHSHSVTMSMNQWPQSRVCSPWWVGGTSYTDRGGYGVMCMYPSSSAPEGWSLCNGTNGTPDMRDRFILISPNTTYGGWAAGSFNMNWTGTTNNAGSHQHRSVLYPYAVPTSNHYHSNNLGNEAHAFNHSQWWAPRLWGIYWIMFTG